MAFRTIKIRALSVRIPAEGTYYMHLMVIRDSGAPPPCIGGVGSMVVSAIRLPNTFPVGP